MIGGQQKIALNLVSLQVTASAHVALWATSLNYGKGLPLSEACGFSVRMSSWVMRKWGRLPRVPLGAHPTCPDQRL